MLWNIPSHFTNESNRQNYLQDPAPAVRGMGIQAVRFTLAENDETFDDVLKPMLIQMLSVMLKDPHLENRRLALSALNSATHNKPDIILPHLAQLLPLVIQESKIKPELVREVQMGPFKHKVDDGLEVRKVSLVIACLKSSTKHKMLERV